MNTPTAPIKAPSRRGSCAWGLGAARGERGSTRGAVRCGGRGAPPASPLPSPPGTYCQRGKPGAEPLRRSQDGASAADNEESKNNRARICNLPVARERRGRGKEASLLKAVAKKNQIKITPPTPPVAFFVQFQQSCEEVAPFVPLFIDCVNIAKRRRRSGGTRSSPGDGPRGRGRGGDDTANGPAHTRDLGHPPAPPSGPRPAAPCAGAGGTARLRSVRCGTARLGAAPQPAAGGGARRETCCGLGEAGAGETEQRGAARALRRCSRPATRCSRARRDEGRTGSAEPPGPDRSRLSTEKRERTLLATGQCFLE